MLLPARMAVLNQLSKVKKLSISEAMEDLKRDYGQEGQFNSSAYLEHFMSLIVVQLSRQKSKHFIMN